MGAQQLDMLNNQWGGSESAMADFSFAPTGGGGAMDPLTTSAMISAGSNVLGKMMSPSASPSRADSGGYNTFDHSGWTLSTGSSKASGSQVIPTYAWALGALALVVWYKRGR